jgi:predicted exporter
VVALGPEPAGAGLSTAVAQVLDLPETSLKVQDLAWSVGTPLREAWDAATARVRVGALLAALRLPADHPSGAELATIVLDLDVPTVAIADASADAPLQWTVSGLPVMHRGLSRSVTANQYKSLGFALGLVALILSIAFRSIPAGLLAAAPTALSLAIIYGGMGLMGIHLDIGTSMLASLIIGAGVDYAVHLQSSWYAEPGEPLTWAAARSAVRVGPAIWTNALMVSVGFFVLTLGEARPLQNVGGLTAAAMLVAAIVTFLVIPVLAGRRSYSLESTPVDPADAALEGLGSLAPASEGAAD